MSTWAGMSTAARSVYVWGIYMMVVGVAFMALPNEILPLLDFEIDKEPWPVVGASLIAILGGYYVVAARHEQIPFIRATIYGRILLNIWFATLVLLHRSQWELLVLGIPDLFGAAWTYYGIKKLPPGEYARAA